MTLEDVAISLETLAAQLRALKSLEQPWLVEVVVQRELAPTALPAQPHEVQARVPRTGSH